VREGGMTKMKFNRNMYYNDLVNPLYIPGVIYDVDNKMVERWIKRGGEIVCEEEKIEVPVETVKEKTDDTVKAAPVKRTYGKRNQ
jgi:hypothetical protein